MSRSSDAANAVVNAIEQVCALYGVDSFRMQSRVIMVEGAAGRMRPMYFGKWRDRFGEVHSSGMADVLARPRVQVATLFGAEAREGEGSTLLGALYRERITVPLWVEGKSGSGKLTEKQRLFKAHVEWNGESYLEISNDVRPLIAWFDAHGVKKCEHCAGKRWMHKIGETPIHCPKCDPRK